MIQEENSSFLTVSDFSFFEIFIFKLEEEKSALLFHLPKVFAETAVLVLGRGCVAGWLWALHKQCTLQYRCAFIALKRPPSPYIKQSTWS
jgi:hypothetical protein